MKYITLTRSGMLAGLANMLETLGYDTDDQAIALGMEAPYLVIHENGRYYAGTGLYEPRWFDLYLRPRGFRIVEEKLPAASVPARLRFMTTAMLKLHLTKTVYHPVVFTGYADGRYAFVNVKRAASSEDDTFSLSRAMLLSRLDDEVTLYTLETCPPQPVDFIALLSASLDNLASFLYDLLAARRLTVTREELKDLNTRLFLPLMHDLLPLAALTGDSNLVEDLRLLEHDRTHIFTLNDPSTVSLRERLPKGGIVRSLTWLYEDILDRLYYLGADEELLTAKQTFLTFGTQSMHS